MWLSAAEAWGRMALRREGVLPVSLSSSALKPLRTEVWQLPAQRRKKGRNIIRSADEAERITATWDAEIEFKPLVNKWCTQLTGEETNLLWGIRRAASRSGAFMSQQSSAWTGGLGTASGVRKRTGLCSKRGRTETRVQRLTETLLGSEREGWSESCKHSFTLANVLWLKIQLNRKKLVI